MALMVSEILFEFMHENIVCARIYRQVHFVQGRRIRRRKRQIKSARFQVCITSKLRGLFLSNLVCEVVYIGGTTYINLVEIAPIVFKLQ